MSEITIYGFSASPYVRKVMVLCAEKDFEYQNIPVSPRDIPADLKPHSPLSKIPFAKIGDKWLADSSVICQYLETIHPAPAMYPADPYDRARALWFEEYIDGGAVPKTREIVFQRVITPLLLGKPGDETLVAQTLANELPPVLDYLDAEVGDRAFLVGDQLTIADITVASYFVNIMHGRVEIDPARWPNVIRHRDAMWRRPSFDRLIEQEKHMIATLAAGAAVPAG